MLPHPSWQPLFDIYELGPALDAIYGDPSAPPVYPPRHQIFAAFALPVSDIQVVLLGQDPYHGAGQAHGLAFSVLDGVAAPPSLLNIWKELAAEFPERGYVARPATGNLAAWVEQGIFLLNTALTVEESRPGSHAALWCDFTDDVIRFVAKNNATCIFLLLGNHAKGKASICRAEGVADARVICGVHPSPLSAARGFFGSGIFRRVEAALGRHIEWQTPLTPEE
jgi:uracil-DNA glycosylase